MIEKGGSWLLAFGPSLLAIGFWRKAKDFTAKDAKSVKERESNYQLTTGVFRFYGLDLTERLNRGERRECSVDCQSSDVCVFCEMAQFFFVLCDLCGEPALTEC